MLFYIVDIQLGSIEFSESISSEIKKLLNFELASITQLFEDPGSSYYRIEFFSTKDQKASFESFLKKKKLSFKFKPGVAAYSQRLIEQIPSRSLQQRKSLILTSNKILSNSIKTQYTEDSHLRQLTHQRVGLFSDGKKHSQTYTVIPRLERDAFLLNKFANLYAEPLWLNTDHDEDFVKSVISLAQNFRMIRFSSMNIENALDIFSRIQKSISVPVIHSDYYETAILIAAALNNLAIGRGGSLENKNIAILGICTSAMGLLDILLTQNPERITGVDTNFRQLSLFEKKGGMASSIDNVYNNAEVIIIMPQFQSRLDERKLHPDQIILNLSPDSLPIEYMSKENKKFVVSGYSPHPACILPGLFLAVIKSGIEKLEIEHCIKMMNTLIKKDKTPSLLPLPSNDLFSKQEKALL